jgi:L-phenylalanine/L-methionine N-acetyltransferase
MTRMAAMMAVVPGATGPAALRYGRLRMPDDVEIRPFHLDDSDALWRLLRQPGVFETTMTLPSQRADQRRAIYEQLGDDDHVFVAVRHGEVAGSASLHVGTGRRRHTATLGIVVSLTHQRAGVGDALMRAVLDIADRWLGVRRIELGVLLSNQPARRLYEKHGFVAEGVLRQSIAGEGELRDELWMARLRPPMPAEREAAADRGALDAGTDGAPAIEGSVAESADGATIDPAAGDDPAFAEQPRGGHPGADSCDDTEFPEQPRGDRPGADAGDRPR